MPRGDCKGDWSRRRTKLGWSVTSMLEVALVLKSSRMAASALPILLL